MRLKRADRWFAAAVVVGLALRLAWAIYATTGPFDKNSDPYEYLSYATAISKLQGYRINGHLTAFFSPGWPLVLAPMVWLSRVTGWFGVEFGASVVSALLGTTTIWSGGRLAQIWLGDRSRDVAAWLLALAPSAIAITATPLSETPYIAIVFAVLVPVSKVLTAEPFAMPRIRSLVGFGLVVGFLDLVRSQGLVLLPVVAGLVWWRSRSFPAVRRAFGWALLGLVLAIAPAVIRNGVQVGFWSPTSTNEAGSVCMGNSDGATGGYRDDYRFLYGCHWGAPHVSNGQEAAWFRSSFADALRWASNHPLDEVRLIGAKTYLALGQDRNAGALSYTQDLGRFSYNTMNGLWTLIEAWRWATLALAALALWRSRTCRDAVVLWLLPLVTLLTLWGGAVGARMNQMILPFLTLFAAFAIASLRDGPSGPEPRRRRVGTEQDRPDAPAAAFY